MTLAPFFASSSGYGFTKNLLSLPFQAPVFFDLFNANILFCLQPFDRMVAIFDILDIFWGILLEGMRD